MVFFSALRVAEVVRSALLRLLRIGVSGVGPAVADRDAGPFHAFWKSPRRGGGCPGSERGAPAGAAVEDERAVRATARVLALDHRRQFGVDTGSSSPRPRLTPPLGKASPSTASIGRALVFDGRLAETALRAHVFPRIKCPEKIVDSRARVGVLAFTSRIFGTDRQQRTSPRAKA